MVLSQASKFIRSKLRTKPAKSMAMMDKERIRVKKKMRFKDF